MTGKYEPLTDVLRSVAGRGQDTVEFDFDEIDQLVGGLPESAGLRQWWANSSHSQALAWRAAGFHVDQVWLTRRRVRFARGERGGSYYDRGRVPMTTTRRTAVEIPDRAPIDAPVDVRVRASWHDAGIVRIDAGGKPAFEQLEQTPGLYRLTLTGGITGTRSRITSVRPITCAVACQATIEIPVPPSRPARVSTHCCESTSARVAS